MISKPTFKAYFSNDGKKVWKFEDLDAATLIARGVVGSCLPKRELLILYHLAMQKNRIMHN